MNASAVYVAAAILVLAIVLLLVLFVWRDRSRLTPLTSLAFAFVLAGIIFGHDRLLSYSLLGVGVVLALIDLYTKSRSR